MSYSGLRISGGSHAPIGTSGPSATRVMPRPSPLVRGVASEKEVREQAHDVVKDYAREFRQQNEGMFFGDKPGGSPATATTVERLPTASMDRDDGLPFDQPPEVDSSKFRLWTFEDRGRRFVDYRCFSNISILTKRRMAHFWQALKEKYLKPSIIDVEEFEAKALRFVPAKYVRGQNKKFSDREFDTNLANLSVACKKFRKELRRIQARKSATKKKKGTKTPRAADSGTDSSRPSSRGRPRSRHRRKRMRSDSDSSVEGDSMPLPDKPLDLRVPSQSVGNQWFRVASREELDHRFRVERKLACVLDRKDQVTVHRRAGSVSNVADGSTNSDPRVSFYLAEDTAETHGDSSIGGVFDVGIQVANTGVSLKYQGNLDMYTLKGQFQREMNRFDIPLLHIILRFWRLLQNSCVEALPGTKAALLKKAGGGPKSKRHRRRKSSKSSVPKDDAASNPASEQPSSVFWTSKWVSAEQMSHDASDAVSGSVDMTLAAYIQDGAIQNPLSEAMASLVTVEEVPPASTQRRTSIGGFTLRESAIAEAAAEGTKSASKHKRSQSAVAKLVRRCKGTKYVPVEVYVGLMAVIHEALMIGYCDSDGLGLDDDDLGDLGRESPQFQMQHGLMVQVPSRSVSMDLSTHQQDILSPGSRQGHGLLPLSDEGKPLNSPSLGVPSPQPGPLQSPRATSPMLSIDEGDSPGAQSVIPLSADENATGNKLDANGIRERTEAEKMRDIGLSMGAAKGMHHRFWKHRLLKAGTSAQFLRRKRGRDMRLRARAQGSFQFSGFFGHSVGSMASANDEEDRDVDGDGIPDDIHLGPDNFPVLVSKDADAIAARQGKLAVPGISAPNVDHKKIVAAHDAVSTPKARQSVGDHHRTLSVAGSLANRSRLRHLRSQSIFDDPGKGVDTGKNLHQLAKSMGGARDLQDAMKIAEATLPSPQGPVRENALQQHAGPAQSLRVHIGERTDSLSIEQSPVVNAGSESGRNSGQVVAGSPHPPSPHLKPFVAPQKDGEPTQQADLLSPTFSVSPPTPDVASTPQRRSPPRSLDWPDPSVTMEEPAHSLGVSPNHVRRESYLDPDEEKHLSEIILEDWKTDSEGGKIMDFAQFHRSLFELADQWTFSADVQEYRDFLQSLYYFVTRPHRGVVERHEKMEASLQNQDFRMSRARSLRKHQVESHGLPGVRFPFSPFTGLVAPKLRIDDAADQRHDSAMLPKMSLTMVEDWTQVLEKHGGQLHDEYFEKKDTFKDPAARVDDTKGTATEQSYTPFPSCRQSGVSSGWVGLRASRPGFVPVDDYILHDRQDLQFYSSGGGFDEYVHYFADRYGTFSKIRYLDAIDKADGTGLSSTTPENTVFSTLGYAEDAADSKVTNETNLSLSNAPVCANMHSCFVYSDRVSTRGWAAQMPKYRKMWELDEYLSSIAATPIPVMKPPPPQVEIGIDDGDNLDVASNIDHEVSPGDRTPATPGRSPGSARRKSSSSTRRRRPSSRDSRSRKVRRRRGASVVVQMVSERADHTTILAKTESMLEQISKRKRRLRRRAKQRRRQEKKTAPFKTVRKGGGYQLVRSLTPPPLSTQDRFYGDSNNRQARKKLRSVSILSAVDGKPMDRPVSAKARRRRLIPRKPGARQPLKRPPKLSVRPSAMEISSPRDAESATPSGNSIVSPTTGVSSPITAPTGEILSPLSASMHQEGEWVAREGEEDLSETTPVSRPFSEDHKPEAEANLPEDLDVVPPLPDNVTVIDKELQHVLDDSLKRLQARERHMEEKLARQQDRAELGRQFRERVRRRRKGKKYSKDQLNGVKDRYRHWLRACGYDMGAESDSDDDLLSNMVYRGFMDRMAKAKEQKTKDASTEEKDTETQADGDDQAVYERNLRVYEELVEDGMVKRPKLATLIIEDDPDLEEAKALEEEEDVLKAIQAAIVRELSGQVTPKSRPVSFRERRPSSRKAKRAPVESTPRTHRKRMEAIRKKYGVSIGSPMGRRAKRFGETAAHDQIAETGNLVFPSMAALQDWADEVREKRIDSERLADAARERREALDREEEERRRAIAQELLDKDQRARERRDSLSGPASAANDFDRQLGRDDGWMEMHGISDRLGSADSTFSTKSSPGRPDRPSTGGNNVPGAWQTTDADAQEETMSSKARRHLGEASPRKKKKKRHHRRGKLSRQMSGSHVDDTDTMSPQSAKPSSSVPRRQVSRPATSPGGQRIRTSPSEQQGPSSGPRSPERPGSEPATAGPAEETGSRSPSQLSEDRPGSSLSTSTGSFETSESDSDTDAGRAWIFQDLERRERLVLENEKQMHEAVRREEERERIRRETNQKSQEEFHRQREERWKELNDRYTGTGFSVRQFQRRFIRRSDQTDGNTNLLEDPDVVASRYIDDHGNKRQFGAKDPNYLAHVLGLVEKPENLDQRNKHLTLLGSRRRGGRRRRRRRGPARDDDGSGAAGGTGSGGRGDAPNPGDPEGMQDSHGSKGSRAAGSPASSDYSDSYYDDGYYDDDGRFVAADGDSRRADGSLKRPHGAAGRRRGPYGDRTRDESGKPGGDSRSLDGSHGSRTRGRRDLRRSPGRHVTAVVLGRKGSPHHGVVDPSDPQFRADLADYGFMSEPGDAADHDSFNRRTDRREWENGDASMSLQFDPDQRAVYPRHYDRYQRDIVRYARPPKGSLGYDRHRARGMDHSGSVRIQVSPGQAARLSGVGEDNRMKARQGAGAGEEEPMLSRRLFYMLYGHKQKKECADQDGSLDTVTVPPTQPDDRYAGGSDRFQQAVVHQILSFQDIFRMQMDPRLSFEYEQSGGAGAASLPAMLTWDEIVDFVNLMREELDFREEKVLEFDRQLPSDHESQDVLDPWRMYHKFQEFMLKRRGMRPPLPAPGQPKTHPDARLLRALMSQQTGGTLNPDTGALGVEPGARTASVFDLREFQVPSQVGNDYRNVGNGKFVQRGHLSWLARPTPADSGEVKTSEEPSVGGDEQSKVRRELEMLRHKLVLQSRHNEPLRIQSLSCYQPAKDWDAAAAGGVSADPEYADAPIKDEDASVHAEEPVEEEREPITHYSSLLDADDAEGYTLDSVSGGTSKSVPKRKKVAPRKTKSAVDPAAKRFPPNVTRPSTDSARVSATSGAHTDFSARAASASRPSAGDRPGSRSLAAREVHRARPASRPLAQTAAAPRSHPVVPLSAHSRTGPVGRSDEYVTTPLPTYQQRAGFSQTAYIRRGVQLFPSYVVGGRMTTDQRILMQAELRRRRKRVYLKHKDDFLRTHANVGRPPVPETHHSARPQTVAASYQRPLLDEPVHIQHRGRHGGGSGSCFAALTKSGKIRGVSVGFSKSVHHHSTEDVLIVSKVEPRVTRNRFSASTHVLPPVEELNAPLRGSSMRRSGHAGPRAGTARPTTVAGRSRRARKAPKPKKPLRSKRRRSRRKKKAARAVTAGNEEHKSSAGLPTDSTKSPSLSAMYRTNGLTVGAGSNGKTLGLWNSDSTATLPDSLMTQNPDNDMERDLRE